jgi:solute carrier family 25 phosphate transporter 23/24/25/41
MDNVKLEREKPISMDTTCKTEINNSFNEGKDCNKLHNKKIELKSPRDYTNLIAGGIAGAMSRTLTAPLERLKILYQVNYRCNKLKPPSIFTGLKEVYNTDGFRGLFRGNLMNVIKATPDTAIKLYMFEKIKNKLKRIHGEKLTTDKLFLAGAVAGVASNFTIFPLDVIKTRLSAAPSGTYTGIFDTMTKLYKEGGIRIFYKGVDASICCVIPNSGLNLCFYELLKRFFSGSYSTENANLLSTPVLMITGGLSAMLSSTLLYPLQTIQARVIMQNLSKSELHFLRFNQPYMYIGDNLIIKKKQSMIQVIKSTIQIEGFRGFFKGYGPGISKIIIGNAISFGFYERIKSFLNL